MSRALRWTIALAVGLGVAVALGAISEAADAVVMALFGFFGCVGLIGLCNGLGRLLGRPERTTATERREAPGA